MVAEPATPRTQALGPGEARRLLEADWIFQAEGKPLALRARQEIAWTRSLAHRIANQPGAPSLTAELARLCALERRVGRLVVPDRRRPARVADPQGLVARWSFDRAGAAAATALGPGAPDGRVTGWIEPDSGVQGGCGSFNGSSLVDAGPAIARVTTAPYTVTAWIRTTSTESDIMGSGVGPGHFLFMTYQGVLRSHQWTADSGNVLDGRTRVNDGRWHHAAMVMEEGTTSLYVDGRLDASMPFVGLRAAGPDPLLVAARTASGGPCFSGLLDEVCLYSRALTPAEISAECCAGSAGAAEPAAETGPARDLYLAVRQVKRQVWLKSPSVRMPGVVFIDQPNPAGSEWQHQARHRNGMMAMPGGRLLALHGLDPGSPITQLAPARPGAFWRPDVSFDGRKVLFCYKPATDPAFHLYEVGVDGKGLRQLTSGPYDDIDPIYLPDGHIMFTSSRCNSYVRCMPYTFSYVLARCDADGRNVYLVSQNSEPDWCPSLMNDGRIVYSRWEYTDKALWRIQSLWTTGQDGVGTATFWGNQSVWPDHLAEPRPIPGSNRVMFTGLAHHNWFAGSIGIIDPSRGSNFPNGLTKVTREAPWPECGTPPVDPGEASDYHTSGRFAAYKTPYPISKDEFLVSADKGGKFALYLMDLHGNRELIYEGVHNIWHAMPLGARRRPPVEPSRVVWPGTGPARKPVAPGMFFSADVTQGVPALKGRVRFLRVIQMDAKTYSTWERDARYSGPSLSAFQEDGIKRILGTVPVGSDGSVSFQAPAGVALHFQLLDAQGRALQTMRSFAGLMPGEKRGCLGCHEQHSRTPAPARMPAVGQVARLTPPAWGSETVGYDRFVAPALGRYCASCHTGKGAGRGALDLTPRPSGVYAEPYLTLVNSGLAGAILCENYAQSDPKSYKTSAPMTGLAARSRLVELASSGKHHGVRMDPASLDRLVGWVDANCPYKGAEEVKRIPDPTFAGLSRLGVWPRCASAPIIQRP